MSSVNKCILIGNLGQDPEIRYTADGKAIANLSVATSETWKGKDGEKKTQTEWHRVSLFGKVAEVAGKYLKKGSSAYFEGRIQTRKWTDKEGDDRYTTEIVADRMQMLGEAKGEAKKDVKPRNDAAGGFEDMEDDIPFISCSTAHDPIHKKHKWG